MAEIEIDDLDQCRDLAVSFLQPLTALDWTAPIPDLQWNCERALQHLINTQIYLAMHLAAGAADALPFARGPAAAAGLRPDEMLLELSATTAVLGSVMRTTSDGATAFYGGDRTDRSGALAVACDELLVHSWDIRRGFHTDFVAPGDLALKITGRLFPWAPAAADPWPVLLWCNGRIALDGRPRLGADWRRWLAPLADWDGDDPTGPV
jgi:uncharacterized protein (TIGR03083 family)